MLYSLYPGISVNDVVPTEIIQYFKIVLFTFCHELVFIVINDILTIQNSVATSCFCLLLIFIKILVQLVLQLLLTCQESFRTHAERDHMSGAPLFIKIFIHYNSQFTASLKTLVLYIVSFIFEARSVLGIFHLCYC